jgi:Ribosome biogenesis protein SLX9
VPVAPTSIMPKVSRAPKFRRGAAAAAAAGATAATLPVGERRPKDKKDTATRDVVVDGDPTTEARTSADRGGGASPAGPGRHDGEGDAGRKRTLSASSAISLPPQGSPAASPPKQPLDGTDPPDGGLSRGQRKRQAKKDQYLRKEQLVMASLKLRRDDEQRKRIDGLDAIRNALLESAGITATSPDHRSAVGAAPAPAAAAATTTGMLKTNHSKQKLVQKEAAQMSLVLQHPAFQQDPFDAIRQHLRNTSATRSAAAATGPATSIQNKKAKAESDKEAKEKRVRHRKHRVKATRSKSRK